MRILVTGANGFVGKHLIQALCRRRHQVFAAGVHESHAVSPEIATLHFDIVNYLDVKKCMQQVNPDGVIHLAAQSMVKASWEDPTNTVNINILGTVNIVRAVKEVVPNARVLTIGTSEEYGLTGKKGIPLTEDDKCLPQNPYAISKLAAGQFALQIAQKDQLNVIHVRPFNHFGPGQRTGFVVSDFASQIVQIERNLIPPIIRVGDLTAQRDFTDVRDIVEAYIALMENIEVCNGIYNICSGTAHSIEAILDQLLGYAATPITIDVDQSLFRPVEVPLFVGSAQKIQDVVGWRPKRDFRASILETLQWWRTQV